MTKPSTHTPGRQAHNAVLIAAGTMELRYDRPDEPYAALPWEDRDALMHAIVGDLIGQAASLPGSDTYILHGEDQRCDDLLAIQPERVHSVPSAPMQGGYFPLTVLEEPFLQSYQKYILVLEQTPLIPARLLARTFAQLGAEEECIVVGQTTSGRCAYLGFRSQHRPEIAAIDPAILGKIEALLGYLCTVNVVVVPVPAVQGIQTGVQVELLRETIGALNREQESYPRRTDALFKTFEKKYKLRKPQ